MDTKHIMNILDFYDALSITRMQSHGLTLVEIAAALADVFDESEVEQLTRLLIERIYPETKVEEDVLV